MRQPLGHPGRPGSLALELRSIKDGAQRQFQRRLLATATVSISTVVTDVRCDCSTDRDTAAVLINFLYN